MKKLGGVVFAVMMSLAMAGSAWGQAQITTGVLQGTVTDPSGGVVPGASVEIKNVDTNFTRTMTSDVNGRFVALQLPPGRYTLTVSKPGFATILQQDVELTVGQTITFSFSMKVSKVVETVTVSATPTIDVTATEAGTTLNQRTVENTPILGRKFEDLLTLTPGVSIVQGPDGDEINFSGQRGIFNNVQLDGGDYNNGFFGEQFGGQRASIDITLEAVKEFEVVATGANAEFGRTAGGVVNVITKSGTNELHGSIFHFQRLKALSSDTSDGKPLKDFHREQFGATLGGPIVKDKMFFFASIEQITANLQRDNLSAQIGSTACPEAAPTIPANEGDINGNADCQRLGLINFFQTALINGTPLNQQEGLPIRRPVHNTAALGRFDWNVTPKNQFSASYNFDRSNKLNETFDVPTYGDSANGIEGPSRIQVLNFNVYSNISARLLNEAHYTYAREARPRAAVTSNVPADTAMGFVTTFRFGNPFFLNPKIDELFWRSQLRDNFSIVTGRHTIKFGGEWIHSVNTQVFRGFFTGRYIFDSVDGFIRYASPTASGGFGPTTGECFDSTGAFTGWITRANDESCPAGSSVGGPLLFFLQDGTPTGVVNIPPGASDIANQDYALFIQDKWQIWPNFTFNYGLRWEAQRFPDPAVPPSQTAYGPNLSDPNFPSDGTLHNQWKEFQPRVGFAWDLRGDSKSVLRASWGIFNARQNMLTQVGSITTNGAQQFTVFTNSALAALGFTPTPPTWPGIVPSTPTGVIPPGAGVRVFSKNYANPRIYSTNVAFEQEILPRTAVYVDFTLSKGVHLTRFNEFDNAPPVVVPVNGDVVSYTGPAPFANLSSVFVASSSAKSLYRGLTVGMRKRFGHGFQMEWNYVYSRDLDDDSNERDPFTDRSFNRFDYSKDYSRSDRDEPHRFNFFTYAELPGGFQADVRMQAHSAQPITPEPRVLNGVDQGRNSIRKNNGFFSLDWRVARPIKFGDRMALTPQIEMFNSFNNDNNVNPLITPNLFDFSGFLRQGVGDPRQVQLSLKFTF